MADEKREQKSLKMHFFNSSVFDHAGNLDWRQLIGKAIAVMGFFLAVYAIALFIKITTRPSAMVTTRSVSVPVVFDRRVIAISDSFSAVLSGSGTIAVDDVIATSLAESGYWIGRLLGHRMIKMLTSDFPDGNDDQTSTVWAVVIGGITRYILISLLDSGDAEGQSPPGALATLPSPDVLYYLLIREVFHHVLRASRMDAMIMRVRAGASPT